MVVKATKPKGAGEKSLSRGRSRQLEDMYRAKDSCKTVFPAVSVGISVGIHNVAKSGLPKIWTTCPDGVVGYHICLTRRGSPVRTWIGTYVCNFSVVGSALGAVVQEGRTHIINVCFMPQLHRNNGL